MEAPDLTQGNTKFPKICVCSKETSRKFTVRYEFGKLSLYGMRFLTEWNRHLCDYPFELVIHQLTWEPAEFVVMSQKEFSSSPNGMFLSFTKIELRSQIWQASALTEYAT